MTTGHHWHGYGPWTGPHQFFGREHDHERRPGRNPGDPETAAFIRATSPPLETGHYLLRRDQTKRQLTWTDVQGALDWLAATYAQQPPDPTLDYLDKAARLEHTRTELEGGADSIWHYTVSLSANRVAVFAVICCPHRHHTRTPCPLPPN
ncbi:hypothetical protein [Micromonospora thermarum]|uniref:Uncharacterized protein n=1 Tax=Micromonospora thermarum TaxID=2720024 RepID=A0ABX0ZFW3_9ACTN|nr:hypothetical protein [Micromonospora thermarum]NJP35206.1 hypothetical protein [Micromonospora thermarum]